jgi:uncharacterized tellurite resistance protein B-like protein
MLMGKITIYSYVITQGVDMLNKISTFFNDLIADLQQTTAQQKNTELSLEICCAVLLCEVMRADSAFTEAEQDTLSIILTNQFKLTPLEVSDILVKAFELSENASDFYQFTSKINQHYSLDDRIKIITLLWKVAFADGELASIEEHIIRKIADLLHLRHNEYIATKIAAKEFYRKNEK